MPGTVKLYLLGRFRVTVDEATIEDALWHGHRSKAVVKLLALAPDHQLHREQLTELLWPELNTAAAAANLRKAVHFARRALSPSLLRVRDGVLSLEPAQLMVDVDALDAALTSGEVGRAIELYSDDLLVEDRYEPWAEEDRAQLRDRFVRVLSRTAAGLLHGGDCSAAGEIFERLVRLDPLDEAAVAGLMRANALGAGPAAALHSYQQLEARLRRELGIAPSEQLRGLRDRIAASGRGESVPSLVSPPHADPSQDAGERKLLTVAIVEAIFTAGAADPEVMALDLGRWTSLAAEVFAAWDGVCDPTLPGTLVAAFGIPRLHEDDAARALHACLELRSRSSLALRIGVATGQAVVSTDPPIAARGVTGDVVVTADRLRQAGRTDRITVAERTCRLVSIFRFGNPRRIGGRGLPEVWGRPLIARVVQDTAGASRVQAPMVGRATELAILLGAFRDATRTGRPRLVTVLGPPGIGKTRLVQEATSAVTAHHPETRVLTGRCLPTGRGSGYSGLGEILRQACGIAMTDPVPTVQTKLRHGLTRLFSDTGIGEAALAALAAAIGVALPDTALDRLEPGTVADELRRAWPRFGTALAAPGPALLVIEDLHWAGDELLDALAAMAARVRGPLLIVTTARPDLLERHPSWAAPVPSARLIEPAPLQESHSATLLGHIPQADGLPDTIRHRVLARAEGNPFFLHELALHAASGDTGDLPDTVSAVLASRLDALAPEEKRVLQQASVVGRVFWPEPVARGIGCIDVTGALDRLAEHGFIERRRSSALPGHTQYAFRHALTHEVTYTGIPRGRRARAHAAVADWLEEAVGSPRDDLAELLAFHLGVAAAESGELAWPRPADRERVRERAVRWLILAGDVVRARFATARAVQLHEQALALAGTDAERLTALEALGRDHDAAFHGDAALRSYDKALALARTDPRRAQDRARLCRRSAWLMATAPGAFRVSPDPHAVDRLVEEGLASTADPVSRAWLLLVRGVSARLWRGSEPFGQGREPDPVPIDQRIRAAESAQRVGLDKDQPDLVVAAERALKILYGIAGRYREALALARRHLTTLTAARSTLEQADLLREAAVYAINVQGDLEDGLALARRCHTLSTGMNPHQVMHATWAMLAALYHLGRWRELRTVADEHLTAYRALPTATDCQFVRDGPLIAATVLAHRGDLDAAHTLAATVGNPRDDLDAATPWQAWYALASGDPQTARLIATRCATTAGMTGPQHALALLEALIALQDWAAVAVFLPSARAAAAGNALLSPFCQRATALLAGHRGHPAQAAAQLHAAATHFDTTKMRYQAARTREHLAAVVTPGQGQEYLQAARTAYQQLQAAPDLRRVRARLRDLTGAPSTDTAVPGHIHDPRRLRDGTATNRRCGK